MDRRQPAGENPPPGAILYYYFKTAPKDEVKLEILDGQGTVVKTYTSAKKADDAGPAEWPDVQHLSETLPVADRAQSLPVESALRGSGESAGHVL